MLDRDLAELYQGDNRQFEQGRQTNTIRFPEDFQLNSEEAERLVFQTGIPKNPPLRVYGARRSHVIQRATQ